MSLASFHADGAPYLVCCLAGPGDKAERMTHRRAIACTVEGTALLGPASFPSIRPETSAGERAEWGPVKGWVIFTQARAKR